MTKYKEGDLVTIRLDSEDVTLLNSGCSTYVGKKQIFRHEKAPGPTVLWGNVYKDGFSSSDDNEQRVDHYANPDRLAKLKITIISDDVKAEVIK